MHLQSEVFRKMLDQFAVRMRVACPGIIKSFDPVAQTVEVDLAITEDVVVNGKVEQIKVSVLVDVPILVPRAGNFILTMPVTAGDECLVVFGDNCMDAWWQNGCPKDANGEYISQNQIDKRRHDLSDGFAILGIWSQPNKIVNYSITTSQLRSLDGTTYIEVAQTAVNIVGAQEVNIQAAGKTVIEGKNFLAHQHTGVEPGGGVSGGVA